MKISVGICAYNAEKTIGRTIDSVLAQTYQDFEIIVINDGSTDGTLAIVEGYARENPGKFQIKSIPNGGLANARNVGIQLVSGDLFINLDADDYLEDYAFQKAIEMFSAEENVDICFYGYKCFDETGEFFEHYEDRWSFPGRMLTGMECFEQRIQRRLWIHQGSAIYRTTLFKDKIWNHPGKNQGEDMYFIFRCMLEARKVVCFRGDAFCYMKRRDSMNNMSFNDSFFSITDLLGILTEDIKRIYPENANYLLPMIAAEEAIQRLAIVKRMARSMDLKNYLVQKKRIWDCMSRRRCLSGWKWLNIQKKTELTICTVCGTCYYLLTKLVG